MKKILLIVLAFFAITSLDAQIILNPGFESWVTSSTNPSYEYPFSWNTDNSHWTTLNSLDPLPVVKATDAHTGNYAALFKSLPDTLGYIPVFWQSSYSINYRESKLQFYHKFNLNGDTAYAEVVMTNNFSIIGSGKLLLTNSVGNYSQATVNITYTSSLTPDRMEVYFGYNIYDLQNVGGSEWYIDDITLSGIPAGITDDINNNNEVFTYPNPSNGFFTIDLGATNYSNTKIAIYNNLGELVYNKTLNNAKELITTDLPIGFYTAQIMLGDNIRTQKIVINKR